MERWGGAWSHHTPVNLQPGTRNPSGQRSHPDTAHLACRACWGQALCVRTLEIRVSLRYLLTRTFGQQKQEVVLSYIDFSLETPWRTAWAKVPGLGDETSPSQAEPLSTLDAFTDWALLGEELTRSSNGSPKHWTSLQPQQLSTQLPPSCWTSVGAAPLPIPPEMPQFTVSLLQGSPVLAPSHLLCPGTQSDPSPHRTNTAVLCAHQTLTRDHKQGPPLRKEHQGTSRMVVSLWVLEIHLFSWKNKELIHWHRPESQEIVLGLLREEGAKLSSK